ncbi:EAL domain-containing protein [Rhodocyclus tenuis]|uniref:Diguanylate cyclase (GGDEF)-like protein/PAS domain S-box-containing protein n=1 Tax=Rhodocyclus tenuis TaxID=1066 RepID=A0A840GBY6_RHOTE|nr:EAL domain-containing protein [Rhodocyclus tenuis]MBB4246112.1 diguanylate cyclase (GGDEF)-like protein/PAS domain S-box-containing protein [Rhodocyclus tenuis]
MLNAPRSAKHSIWLILSVVLLVTVMLTLMLAVQRVQSGRELQGQRFVAVANERAEFVEFRILSLLHEVDVLRRLCASEAIDGASFARLSAAVGSSPGTIGQFWATVDDQFRPRLVHGPATLAATLGKELSTNPALASAARRAFASDSAVASILPALPATSARLLIMAPIPAADARRPGLVVLAVDAEALFAAANAGAPISGFDLDLLADAGSGVQPIAHWTSRQASGPPPTTDARLEFEERIDFAGLQFLLRIHPASFWIEANPADGVGEIVLTGAVLGTLLLLLLYQSLTRRAVAEALIEVRTTDLAERQHAYETLVENLPEIILRFDRDWRLLFVNTTFENSLGIARGNLLGRRIGDAGFRLHPGLDAALLTLWRDALTRVFASGQAQAIEFDFPGPAGQRFFEGTLVPESKAPGVAGTAGESPPAPASTSEVSSVIAIFRDVSERRSAESWARRLSLAVEQNPATIVITDLHGDIEYVNKRFTETTGYARDEAIGTNPRLLKSGKTPDAVYREMWKTILAGQTWRGEFINRRRDGSIFQERAQIAPICDEGGAITHFVAIKEDISDMKAMIDRLHESEARFRSVVGAMAEGLTLHDASGAIIFANAAAEGILGLTASELRERNVLKGDWQPLREDGSLLPTADLPVQIALGERREVRGVVCGIAQPDGNLRWLLVNAVPLDGGETPTALTTFSDITERKLAQQRVEFLAHHDPLTRLPNRILLRDRVDQARALAGRLHSRFALLFLDLDHFKTINDSLGHPVGDALLIASVQRLRSCLRESDTLARLGGDEFVIVVNDVRDADAVARVAEKIHERTSETLPVEGHRLIASFSIGIALFPDDAQDFDTLMQQADTAMYHAKQAGRNTYRFFAEEMNAQAIERLELESRLRQAIERDEFVLHYQPQQSLVDRRIVGVEALIRWRNADGEMMQPADFIPIAEDSGLIVPIGNWVLREACRQARAWLDAGHPCIVAVNLSARQFRGDELVDAVIGALVLADLDARWLELELTESLLLQDAETTLETLRRLKAIGIRLAIDDFGTGYSSLAYLKRFDVDKLKIDQSFVRDLLSDPDDAAIVHAIIEMAHSMQLKTIAEGVETQALADRLRLFHCDEAQGYWFARPLPAAEIGDFLRRHAEPGQLPGS